MSLFRLVFTLYGFVPDDRRSGLSAFRVVIHRSFRSFIRLPRSTPNRILEDMLGDLGPLSEGVGTEYDAERMVAKTEDPQAKACCWLSGNNQGSDCYLAPYCLHSA